MVALDTPDLRPARAWAAATAGIAGMVKVGLELSAAGPAAVEALIADGHRVMLDLKLHDIPNTVAAAVHAAAGSAPSCSPSTPSAAGDARGRRRGQPGRRPGDRGRDRPNEPGRRPASPSWACLAAAESVPRLAALAVAAGAGAIVCSPLEAAAVRAATGDGVRIICPGVRPAEAAPPGPAPRCDPGGRGSRPAPTCSWSGARSPARPAAAAAAGGGDPRPGGSAHPRQGRGQPG